MKSVIFGSLSVLLLSAAFAPNTLAQQAETARSSATTGSSAATTYRIEPFNLAWMAYQGYFQAQGIPAGRTLIAAFKSADISAREIVQAAAKSGRLPSEFSPDSSYLGAMEITLGKIAAR
ncbi:MULTISPECIES: hypothetical protein [Aerosakkonema]|uniref:hypothetical protein n=1 Tax=Aerosakkonema TaxID=1246629 RepID=UPI0035B6FEC6